MALMLAICKPQPNWMPRKPKLMFHICQKLRSGLRKWVTCFVLSAAMLSRVAALGSVGRCSVCDVLMAVPGGASVENCGHRKPVASDGKGSDFESRGGVSSVIATK